MICDVNVYLQICKNDVWNYPLLSPQLHFRALSKPFEIRILCLRFFFSFQFFIKCSIFIVYTYWIECKSFHVVLLYVNDIDKLLPLRMPQSSTDKFVAVCCFYCCCLIASQSYAFISYIIFIWIIDLLW